MIKFSLLQKEHEFELSYGAYNIYLSGGFEVENIESLDIHLIDTKSNETITLKEKNLKPRDIISNERVILCYSFDVYNYSKYKLTIANPEIIAIKRNYNMQFSVLSLFMKNNVIPSEMINVIIN
jgi:hypothetical protein